MVRTAQDEKAAHDCTDSRVYSLNVDLESENKLWKYISNLKFCFVVKYKHVFH